MIGLQPRLRRLLQCWLRWLVEVLLRIERAALGALHSMVDLGARLLPLRGVPVLLLMMMMLLLLLLLLHGVPVLPRGLPVLLLLLLMMMMMLLLILLLQRVPVLLLWRRSRPGVVVVSCAVERSRLFMWCMALLLVRVTRVTGLIVM